MLNPLLKNVLVAVNGSEASMHASMYGILLAKQLHVNLKAVFVVDTATLKQLTMTKLFVADESESYETNLVADGEHYLQYIIDLAKQKGVQIETELRKGAVWSEIIACADEFNADLILIGGRKINAYDSMRRNVISASRGEIISGAHCSVMVVRKSGLEQIFKQA
ncbi:universal stress protein [Treponema parvum]|uniref:Universal stress protein n=1 Tax=Treponema parvum TaxID=138851 RepID=A0A975F4H1_9SPIR|nr:universal stress protein [Treponema parvum]QTQ14464.1 universal stress protein [Treponema parvum]